jgi:hypothetical protein
VRTRAIGSVLGAATAEIELVYDRRQQPHLVRLKRRERLIHRHRKALSLLHLDHPD